MPNYICWTKYRESGVIMEEGEEEHKEFEDDGIIAEYGALNDTPMGKLEERKRHKMSLLMILVTLFGKHRENVTVKKRRSSSGSC